MRKNIHLLDVFGRNFGIKNSNNISTYNNTIDLLIIDQYIHQLLIDQIKVKIQIFVFFFSR